MQVLVGWCPWSQWSSQNREVQQQRWLESFHPDHPSTSAHHRNRNNLTYLNDLTSLQYNTAVQYFHVRLLSWYQCSGIFRNVKRGPKGEGPKVLSEAHRRKAPERQEGWGLGGCHSPSPVWGSGGYAPRKFKKINVKITYFSAFLQATGDCFFCNGARQN